MTLLAHAVARNSRAYTQSFHESVERHALSSANVVVPIVMNMVHPRSVVDLGCGSGAWLSVFGRHGVTDMLGLDGHRPERLLIPDDSFAQVDLNTELKVARLFDLAICLEVAEHLMHQSAATLIGGLTDLAPVVLFSAAAPGQGGTEHLNERWPDYWAGLFSEKGFAVLDPIRRVIWSNPAVSWWYAQNMLLFVSRDELARRPALKRHVSSTFPDQLNLLHPAILQRLQPKPEFLDLRQLIDHQWRVLLRAPKAAARAVQRRS